MVPAHLAYDPATDQLVIGVPSVDGDGLVTLLRLDVNALSDADKQRLRAVRDPDRPQPAPGSAPVTRR